MGANGLFATGSGSSVTMTGGSIKASGGNAHGVDVTYTGTITLTNVDITTSGASSSAIAADFGGGKVTVTGGTTVVSGNKPAGIYSTGDIRVSDATVTASADNGAVIDADGSVLLNNVKLTGSQHGLLVHNTVGQQSLKGALTVTAKGGAVISARTGNIVNSTAWGTATFLADGETLSGNLVADSTSKLKATLNRVALSIDSSSKWIVKASSILTGLTDPSGLSGSSVTNIIGNGNHVYYDASRTANKSLGGACPIRW